MEAGTYCQKCVLNEYYDNISFNNDGICNFCESYESVSHSVTLQNDEILHGIKNNSDTYDLLIAYSGGKDSTYILYQLVEKYNLNVLAFTYDNHFLSETAMENIHNVSEKLKFDHFFFKYDFNFTKSVLSKSIRLTKENKLESFFKTFGILCYPCFMLLSIAAFNLAHAYRIKYIVGGWSLGQLPNLSKFSDEKTVGFLNEKAVFHHFIHPLLNELKLKEFPSQIKMYSNQEKQDISIIPYFLFEQYSERKVFELIKNKLGWK